MQGDRQSPFLQQPNILISTTDPSSSLWKKCQPVVPDRETEQDLKLRVLENCHVYMDVKGTDAFPTMIVEIATGKSNISDKEVKLMLKKGQ